MPVPATFTGARAVVSLNGRRAAWATQCSYIIETKYDEIRAIDESLPEELAPSQIMVRATLTSLRVPQASSATLLGIQTNILAHLTQPYIQLEIKDRQTDKTILHLPRCMMTRRTGTVAARAIGQEIWEFVCIGYWDELLPKKAPTPIKTGAQVLSNV